MSKHDWEKILPILIAGKDAGKSFAVLAREVDIPLHTLRDRYTKHLGRSVTGRSNHYVTNDISMSEVRRLIAQRPPDIRDLSARLLGDPRPGESALARMKAAGA